MQLSLWEQHRGHYACTEFFLYDLASALLDMGNIRVFVLRVRHTFSQMFVVMSANCMRQLSTVLHSSRTPRVHR